MRDCCCRPVGYDRTTHARNVAAPRDEADLHGQPHLHDRQRHELRGGHLVHPAGDAFRGLARNPDRPADAALARPAALHRCPHRSRRPPSPHDVAGQRARPHHLRRSAAGADSPCPALADLPDEHPGRHRLLDVSSHGQRAHPGADARRQDARLELAAAGCAARRLADGGRPRRLRLQPHRPGRSAAHRLRQLRRVAGLCVPGAQRTRDGIASGSESAEVQPTSGISRALPARTRRRLSAMCGRTVASC